MLPAHRANDVTTLHVPTVWKSGSLDLLEPSGPVQGLLTFTFTNILEPNILLHAMFMCFRLFSQ